jgi:hypothetical protein
MAISKRTRFNVFKRDGFLCAYCGRTPPAVVLEVDHIIPQRSGGTDATHNLTTSCRDCNSGKSGISLDVVPDDVAKSMAIALEKREQVKRFEAMLKAEKRRIDKAARGLGVYWCDRTLPPDKAGTLILAEQWLRSIRTFLKSLPETEVEGAMDSAQSRIDKIPNETQRLKYFCGICWAKIKEARGIRNG